MHTIGKEIREFRKTYNLTQKEICKGICPVSHLSLIENNKVEAKPEVIQLLLERIEEFKSNTEIKNDTVSNENIGKFFFNERLKHGIKQETLCYGICTVSYLSKIENNKLVPSWNIKKLLYKRLEEIKNNTITVDLEILELEKLYDTMILFFDKEKINDAKKMLNRGLRTTKNKYPKLYCLFSYQNHLYFDQTNFKSFLEKTAIPFFKNEKDSKQLSIFYIDLATCYQKENQFEKACFYYQKGISCIRIVKSLNIISSHKNVQLQFS
ncbi:helix-turn-helix domain-containing protein [Bacillus wiedmannii]|uniref:helix-turn-helix domain-containing protein n=1 Tax=Bacillus wiedmannii TaxID=1890302 RepID=UPI000BF88C33|nr:helix-turn-helix transcriptional regulator [Bacillus wiedmannii]PFZ64334.1 transcriptional regulator [Bacillus wiedmannii]PHB60472.1 transcriptional regulator [Bacillus wiedmannii]PHF16738.1 transcriptional regulator [Bacillus wiedmannii]PHG71195.1 transcriptional regulator [Bacillus wiedmannii]